LTLNQIGDEGARAFAEPNKLTQLEVLNVAGNRLTPAGETSLQNSPTLAKRLKLLELV